MSVVEPGKAARLPEVKELFVVLAHNDTGDEVLIYTEGLSGKPFIVAGGPMLAQLMERLPSWAKRAGKTLRLVRFSRQGVVEVYEP